jgi:ATP-dependent helicase HrpB
MRLPIDNILPAVLREIRTSRSLVIEAPPGAGKTTRVPPALLNEFPGEILVLEPRRLAARMAARRVASELGESVGGTVGYQVRFEEARSAKTRVLFLTEGVLTRRMLSDPQLKRASVVILDEFHERHLDGDFSLALLEHLQRTTRPDLRILVMSATLNAAPISKYLGGCPILRSEGKLFDLAVEFSHYATDPVEDQVARALQKLLNEALTGDVLVFLPGAQEIRRATRTVTPIAERAGLVVFPLHGDLSPAEQDRAVSPNPKKKVILSTNVAESSITIEGVTAVIDSGLARVASDSPWTGLPSLEVRRISQASATQRAGRAGRTAPGRVIRLYTREDFHKRPGADTPEILRRELSHLVLQLRAMEASHLRWLDAPPDAALESAETLLNRLQATPEMADLPLPPRLAKLLKEAARLGAPSKGCAVAAVLSAGERGSPDLLTLAEAAWQPQTKRIYDQLQRRFPGRDKAHGDTAILQSVLAAFPDRVARRRNEAEVLLATGGSAKFPGNRHEFLVVLDIGEGRVVRLASPVEPEWLLDQAIERTTLEWNRGAERVEQVTALVYDQLVIEEARAPAAASEETGRLLAERALEVDIGRFVDKDALEQLQSRAAFAGITIDPQAGLRNLSQNLSSFAQLASADLLAYLRPQRLDHLAPERLKLPGGREVKVHYDPGKPPWIESRLQDFFGMTETPRIGKTSVVVHLLAPNRRPVQVTSDLAGFWQRLYPEVKRELSRRYPKHKWP